MPYRTIERLPFIFVTDTPCSDVYRTISRATHACIGERRIDKHREEQQRRGKKDKDLTVVSVSVQLSQTKFMWLKTTLQKIIFIDYYDKSVPFSFPFCYCLTRSHNTHTFALKSRRKPFKPAPQIMCFLVKSEGLVCLDVTQAIYLLCLDAIQN
jgi:hypothetical protein